MAMALMAATTAAVGVSAGTALAGGVDLSGSDHYVANPPSPAGWTAADAARAAKQIVGVYHSVFQPSGVAGATTDANAVPFGNSTNCYAQSGGINNGSSRRVPPSGTDWTDAARWQTQGGRPYTETRFDQYNNLTWLMPEGGGDDIRHFSSGSAIRWTQLSLNTGAFSTFYLGQSNYGGCGW